MAGKAAADVNALWPQKTWLLRRLFQWRVTCSVVHPRAKPYGLDSYTYIWDTGPYMETFSTRQAAKMLGIGSSTLARYVTAGKVSAPKMVQVGGMRVHLWTSREIEQARKMLPNIEDGRSTRHQKQAGKSKKTTP